MKFKYGNFVEVTCPGFYEGAKGVLIEKRSTSIIYPGKNTLAYQYLVQLEHNSQWIFEFNLSLVPVVQERPPAGFDVVELK